MPTPYIAIHMIRSLHATKAAVKPRCRGDAAWGSHAAEAGRIIYDIDCVMDAL